MSRAPYACCYCCYCRGYGWLGARADSAPARRRGGDGARSARLLTPTPTPTLTPTLILTLTLTRTLTRTLTLTLTLTRRAFQERAAHR